MSVNQSRGDKNESSQYRRSGRSGNPASQRNFSGGGKGGAGAGAGDYSGKSFKKVNVNLDPSNSSTGGRTVQNGAHIQPPLRGTPDAPLTSSIVNPTNVAIPKSTLGLPKAPPGNAVSPSPVFPVKGSGDALSGFPLQFGSINPGVMNGMQVPARTNSAPPNLDEQKRAQARLDSLKATTFQNQTIPKQHLPRKDIGPVEPHPIPKEKKDGPISVGPVSTGPISVGLFPTGPISAGPVLTGPSPTQPQKPSGPPIPMQIPFHQPQLHLQFNGPMHLPVGNPPQQPVFVPGIQHHQGFIHQTGHPQLGNIGINLGPQYPQQHIGNFGGTGTRRTVKITHPDTHEELKLDKRTDGFAKGGSSVPRSQPLGPGPSFPINYYSNSYNPGSVFYPPPGSNPSTSAQTTPGSHAPRVYNQVTVKPAVSLPATHARKDSEMISVSKPESLTEKSNVTIDGPVSTHSKPDDSEVVVNSTETISSISNSDISESKERVKEQQEEPVNNNIDIKSSTSVSVVESVLSLGSDDRLISSNNIDSKESIILVSVSEASPSLEVNDQTGSISPSSSGSIDKNGLETGKGKGSNTSKRKKIIKEILKNADALGTTSDLYTAYKQPDEKKETLSAQIVDGLSGFTPKQEPVDSSEKDEKRDVTKFEPDDWEDVVDDSTSDPEALGTKKYSRDFLLKFSDHCTDLPEGFEITSDIAEALIGSNREPHPSPGRAAVGPRLDRRPSNVADDDKWSKVPGPMGQPGFRPGHSVLRNPRGPASGMLPIPSPGSQRNNSDSDRWQRAVGYQKGLIPSPHTPVMHKAEKKYEIGKITDEEQAKQRQLKGILNKLTPQNFEKLFEQVKQVNIDNAGTLSGVIGQIFDKALMEPTFVEMYANFCSRLSVELPDFSEDNQKITFKRLLLNKCQEEFERGEREQEEANRAEEEGEVKQTEEEREEKRVKARRLMLGNIRLIGELYKKKMLTERIMHECIKKLLGQYQNPDEEDIEALCKLMSTIGEMIDHSKAKEHMDVYFDMMYKLSNNMELSSRLRFMLKDVIDLRKNKWLQRRKVEGPKKIEEVHRDAAQERQAQSSRLARGPNPNVRRVQVTQSQPVDFGPRGSMGGFRGLSGPVRGYGNQDARFEERHAGLSVPVRPVGDESITLGPQGGLARGMLVRGPGPPLMGGPNGYGSERFDRVQPSSPSPQARVPTPPQSGSSDKVLDEDWLRDKSIEAIKEFYSARDEKEVAQCIKDLNAPGFYPSMISIWVTDSFERKDMERDSLAKLLIDFAKSQDGILTQDSLLKGLESVLSTLEDAVNDAPKAAEFLGRILSRILLENVIPYNEMWQLIYEGGEEQGRLVEIGLAAEVLGVVLEIIKSEKGNAFLNDIRADFNPRIENFRPANIKKSLRLDKFI